MCSVRKSEVLDALIKRLVNDGWETKRLTQLQEAFLAVTESPLEVNQIEIFPSELGVRDRLDEAKYRALGLELAIMAVSKECALGSYGDALAQLALDLSKSLEDLRKDTSAGNHIV